MEVITENPIVYIGPNDTYDAEIYLYANDEKSATKTEAEPIELKGVTVKGKPTDKEIADAKKKGLTWDSVNKVFKKAEELGIVDSLLRKIGVTPKTTSDIPPVGVDAPIGPSGEPVGDDKDKGMSTTTKVLIGVGVLAVIGVILYATSNSSSNKSTKSK